MVLRAILRKELREVVRDGRFLAVALVLALLTVAALGFGLRQSARLATERRAASETAEEHWREQGDKNPHVAAHYGTWVFKPAGALAFVDPGVDAFLGASIKLEAHRRNTLEGAAARDATALGRFGRLSVAAILQLFVPLLILGLGFSAFTGERERGTLRLLATTGVARGRLLLGKALGLGAALGILLLPALGLGAIVVGLVGADGAPLPGAGEPGHGALAGRALGLAAVYAVYFATFLALTLGVSAAASTSRAALVTLLGLWVVTALVVPRVAADAAALIAPAPTPAALAADVRRSVEEGLPGGPPREERVTALTEELLEQAGFKGAETLMDAALLNGLELQAEARFENEVIDHHFARWAAAIERQDRLVQAAALLSPPVAVRSLSMALAGTDTAHHRDFAESAERHRRALIEMLNREFAEKGGTDAWSYQAGRDTWERAPAFRYERPTLAAALAGQRVALGLLGAWTLLSVAFAVRATRRLEVT